MSRQDWATFSSMRDVTDQFLMGLIYEQTSGSVGVLCMWEEEARDLLSLKT